MTWDMKGYNEMFPEQTKPTKLQTVARQIACVCLSTRDGEGIS